MNTGIPSPLLIDQLKTLAGEQALLTFSDAPPEELREVQRKIDQVEQELNRRMAW